MLLAEEVIGPYSVGFLVIFLVALAFGARYLKRGVSLEAGPLKAKLGEIQADAKEAAVAARVVGESIGEANGAGSVQAQLAAATKRMERLEEAIYINQHMMAQAVHWQEAHGEADLETFQSLNEAVGFLKEVIGEPAPGDLQEPLITYMHRIRHETANDKTHDRLMLDLQHQTLSDAMDMLREMSDKLADAAATAEKVATDLAESQQRADQIVGGEPGEAADAGAQSGKET